MAIPQKFRPKAPLITVSAESAVPMDCLIMTSRKPEPVGWLYAANGRLCAAISHYTLEPGAIRFTVIPDSQHPVLKSMFLTHAIFVFQVFNERTQVRHEPEATLYRVRPGAFLADGRLSVYQPPLVVVRGQDSTLFSPLTIPTGTNITQPRK